MRITLISALTLVMFLAIAEHANAADGEAVYGQTCVVCHGADGKGGIPGVPNLNAKDGPLSKDDAELVKNMTDGFQSPGSFMAMPPKGGNPGLTKEDIAAVLAYIRSEFGK